MRARSESVETKATTRGQRTASQRSKTDDSGTQERRRDIDVRHDRQHVCVCLRHCGVFREATINIPPGKDGVRTQVFPPLAAPTTRAAGRPQPRNANTCTRADPRDQSSRSHYGANDLVTWYSSRTVRAEFTIDHVEVGAAHAARLHAHKQLVIRDIRDWSDRPRQHPWRFGGRPREHFWSIGRHVRPIRCPWHA